MATQSRVVEIQVTWTEPDSSFPVHIIYFRIRLRTKDAAGKWQWRYNSGLVEEYSDGGGTGWSASPTIDWDDAYDDIKCYCDIYQSLVEIEGVLYTVDHDNIFETITANSDDDFTPHLSSWDIAVQV